MNEAQIKVMWSMYDQLKSAGHDLERDEARKMMDQVLAYLSEAILCENGQDKTIEDVAEDMAYADQMRSVIESLSPVAPVTGPCHGKKDTGRSRKR